MKLVEQLSLGLKTILSLVAFDGKYYLFAHQDNAVSLIKELDELADAGEIIDENMEQFTPRTAREFDKLLKSMASDAPGKLHKIKKTIWTSLTAEVPGSGENRVKGCTSGDFTNIDHRCDPDVR
ncbi:MAG: flagellar biosynthetic protein FliO [Candidatus Syntrophopropionicum ammoniitolerans]